MRKDNGISMTRTTSTKPARGRPNSFYEASGWRELVTAVYPDVR